MTSTDTPMATPRDDDSDLSLVKEILRSNERAAKLAADATSKAILELKSEVVGLRADLTRLAPSPRMIIGAIGTIAGSAVGVLALAGYLVIHLTTLIAASKGVDVNAAATATETVIGATAEATHKPPEDLTPIPLDTDGDN